MPTFVRYCADCAICCRLSTEAAACCVALPMKLLNGMAGMNWPSVPLSPMV